MADQNRYGQGDENIARHRATRPDDVASYGFRHVVAVSHRCHGDQRPPKSVWYTRKSVFKHDTITAGLSVFFMIPHMFAFITFCPFQQNISELQI